MPDDTANPYAPPTAPLAAEADEENRLFFPVGATKLVVMSICTFSLYELYWFYKNFRCMQGHGRDIWPIPRAIFFPFTAYSLFDHVRKSGIELQAGGLAVAVFLLNVSWRLPDPWSLVSILTFLPLLPARRAIERLNDEAAPDADGNTVIRGWNYAAVVFGGLLWLAAIAGYFLPDQPV